MRQSSLYGNAFFLMLNSAATSLLGFVFWNIMAANFTPNQVGIGSTLISSSILLGTLSNMGLGIGLIRFVPLEKNACRLVNAAFTITCIMAVTCSLIYLAGLNIFAPVLGFMLDDYRLSIVFVVIIVCTSLSLITDQSLVAARCARFVFWKNLITCVLKRRYLCYFSWLGDMVFLWRRNGYCDRSCSVMGLSCLCLSWIIPKAGIQIGHHSKHLLYSFGITSLIF